MKNLLRSITTKTLFRWLKRLWPQIPLGTLLLYTGAVNILSGLQSQEFSPTYQLLAQEIHLSELSKGISLGILGSSVQILLGSGMLVTGIVLFWRLRSAWAYSILFLIISLSVDIFSHRPNYNLLLPGLALTALVIWEGRFEHRSLIGGYLLSFFGLLAVFGYGVLGSILLGNMFQPNIQDLTTALYFTVATLSTVGSKIYPATSQAELFMVTLILGGISIFTTTIVVTLGPLISNQISPILSGKKVKWTPGNRVILAGEGSFARSLAIELTRHKINFTQIIAPDEVPALREQPVILGHISEDILQQAGISEVNTIILADENDEANVNASLLTKKINQNVRVVIVVNSSKAISQLKLAQADLVFNPTVVGARLLTNLISGYSIPKELRDIIQAN